MGKNVQSFYKETVFKQDILVGKIPKGWEIVKIEDVAETSSGGTPNRGKKGFYNGKIPWVKSGELEDNTINDTEEKITEKGLKHSSAKLFPKGTLLVAMYGATVGKTGILAIDATTNQAICAILPKKKCINLNFLKYYLIYSRKKWVSQSSGGAQPNISQGIIRTTKIPKPPLFEQKKIVEVLSCADSAIQKIDEIIVKTQHLKKGLMQQLLTEGIGHKEFRETEIGNFPKTWGIKSLSEIFKLTSGKTRPKRISENATLEKRYPVYGGNGVMGYASKYLLDKETIVIGRVGEYCGAVYKSSRFSWITDNALYAVEIKNELDLDFLVFLLRFLNLNKYKKKMGQPLLTQAIIHRIKIPFPPLSEQRDISSYLSCIDRKLELESSNKIKLERIKQGLMDLFLTGKVRIKVD